MKHVLLFGLMLASFFSYSQYPASGVKQRLGWQTTGDGLVYRGAIADTATINPGGLNNAWMLLDTVNGNLYAYREHWWQLVSGGGGGVSMPFDSVTFNINEGDASEQELKYSAEKGYLQYGGLDSVQIPLLPGIWYVRNDDSVPVSKGMVVRASGTLGASGRIKVKRMIADGTIPAMYVLGIAMHDIAVGADGYVMTQGKIRQVNTQAYSEGAVLYADVDTLGGLTQTEPGNGYLKLPIAFVVHSASNGTLAVRINPGSSLRDLHDVDTAGRVDGSVLRYDSALKYWKASTTAGIVAGDTSVFVRDFQVSGSTWYLPRFKNSNSLENSVLYQTGNKILMGTTSGNLLSRNFEIHAADSTSPFTQTSMDVYFGNNTNADWTPYFQLYRSRSNTVNGVARVNNGDWLGRLTFQGADGAKYIRAAQVYAITDAATALDSVAASLRFATTANGSTVPTDRMSITSAGRVGIGTTSPNAPLTVIGASSFGGLSAMSGRFSDNVNSSLYISHSSTSGPVYSASITSSDDLAFGQTTTGGTTEYMRIKASTGRVGIGTTSPARTLHISATDAVRIPAGSNTQRTPSGVTNAIGDLRYNTEDSVENIEWYDVTGTYRRPVISALPTGLGTAGRFAQFKAGGLDSSNVLVQTNNRIGIGAATSPDSTLHVFGGATITTGIRSRTLTGGTSATDSLILQGTNGAGTGTTTAIAFRVGNNGATRAMTILNNGRVGIGTASPSEVLEVNGTARATRLAVNTYTTQALSINNYAPTGSDGYNIWIGNGGQSSSYSTSTVDGSYNIGIGLSSLRENTTGQLNTAIGVSTLTNNSTGKLNTAVGTGTLTNNTIGQRNTAIGVSALGANITGDDNTGVGLNTVASNTSGNGNTGVGGSALVFNTSGSYNTSVGYLAGTYASPVPLSNQTSSYSTYVGYNTRASVSGAVGETVIGSEAIGNGTNTVTIGGSSNTGTYFPAGSVRIAGSVRVGSTSSPTAAIHLPAGTSSANTAPLKFTSGTSTTTPEAGAVEWNGTNLFLTNSSASRRTVNQGLTGSTFLQFGTTAAQTSKDLTVTVTGASDGDVVSLGVPNGAVHANSCYTAWVSAANTVTIRFNNYSSASIAPGNYEFKIFVTKF